MHVFTSITANYLPKAAVLAHSLKRTNPGCTFHLLLSDNLPQDTPPATLAAFDHVVTPDKLPIKNLKAWTFGHSVVEL